MKKAIAHFQKNRFHLFLLIALFLSLSIVITYSTQKSKNTLRGRAQQAPSPTGSQAIAPTPAPPFLTLLLAQKLEIPWALDFLPDGSILFTERPGRVKMIDKRQITPAPDGGPFNKGPVIEVGTISEVKHSGEGGLLGIAVHPQYATNKFIYVYYTYADSGGNTLNRVVRFTFENNQITNQTTIVDAIPGASNHNGGRIKFGPDGFLYITTGDAANPSLAQDTNSLAGKILRVTDTGEPAPGNPFGNRVYTYGHRNPQGIAWDGATMYATEHGNSGHDEINLIEPGKNYGWPIIEGTQTGAGMVTPLKESGADTWAPSGAAFFQGSLYFAGLKGKTLYELQMQGTTLTLKEHFKDMLGRIREAVVGPAIIGQGNMLYIATSNRDGRGTPAATHDWIVMVRLADGSPSPSPIVIYPTRITPTFVVIAPCPSCPTPTLRGTLPTVSPTPITGSPTLPPSQTPMSPPVSSSPTYSLSPTGSLSLSPIAGSPTLAPSQEPGPAPEKPNKRKGRQRGLISKLIQLIFQLIKELFELLISLLR